MVTERAQIVIGADGLRSFVARSVQAPSYNARPALTCAYYSYWSDLPLAGAELYPRPNQMIAVGPTNDNLSSITIIWPSAAFHKVRADIEGSVMQALDLVPSLAERVRNAKRAERFVGTADLPFFFRKPYGPGWALVGDAGYHKDPITAQGITDAFRDADLLAEAIGAGLSGQRPLDAALAGYEQQRNAAAMPLYDFTYQLAGLAPPPPEMQQLFAALRDNQEQTNRFFGLIAGTVPFSEFFAPENLERIMGAAAPVAA
jgi:2-polyprenyl-6-methoxyphenol hydroxylase-like FAD-dependent oxidoreductase